MPLNQAKFKLMLLIWMLSHWLLCLGAIKLWYPLLLNSVAHYLVIFFWCNVNSNANWTHPGPNFASIICSDASGVFQCLAHMLRVYSVQSCAFCTSPISSELWCCFFATDRSIHVLAFRHSLPSLCLEQKVQKSLHQESSTFNLGDGWLVAKSRTRKSCVDLDKANDEGEDADFPVLVLTDSSNKVGKCWSLLWASTWCRYLKWS